MTIIIIINGPNIWLLEKVYDQGRLVRGSSSSGKATKNIAPSHELFLALIASLYCSTSDAALVYRFFGPIRIKISASIIIKIYSKATDNSVGNKIFTNNQFRYLYTRISTTSRIAIKYKMTKKNITTNFWYEPTVYF